MSRTTASGRNSLAARTALVPVCAARTSPALVAQRHRDQLGDVHLVVDDEDAQRGSVGPGSAPWPTLPPKPVRFLCGPLCPVSRLAPAAAAPNAGAAGSPGRASSSPVAVRRHNGPTMSEASTVEITYPPELPVTQRREDIAAAIRDHQVVIIAGETGSGKTTQIPKICLELGRGRPGPGGGLIGHTQPRRIAARSVAERIASELKTELGDLVGYQVRFTDRTSKSSRVKLMTDGILLAELQRDRHAAEVRHDHHRRGPRAQPQHRLPAGLPAPAAAPAPRPQADHHLGDDRPGAVRRALRRPRRQAGADHRGVRADLPGRGPLPPARSSSPRTTRRARPSSATRPRRSSTRSGSSPPRARATSSCSCPASGRSATPPTRCADLNLRNPARGRAALLAALGRRAAPGLRSRTPAAGSCSPPTSPRRR